jgi:predicted ATPase
VSNSYIEALYLKNFRQFEDLKVRFNPGFNFIAGPNGCGKTSILAAISHCFSHSTLGYSRFKSDAALWSDVTSAERKYRVGYGEGFAESSSYRSSSLKSWERPPQEPGRENVFAHSVKTEHDFHVPLFIGAMRNIKYRQIRGMEREKTPEQYRSSYLDGTKSLYGDQDVSIKQWMINRYFVIDKDWAAEEKLNWEHMIGSLREIAPFDSDFSYVRTGRDLEPVFRLYGSECYLEELSAGFQAVLSIIAGIIEWVEGTRTDGDRSVESASGTVLIDELDLHLHPEWQFTLRNGLQKIFPNLQFIVTTHSPHILASALQGEVIAMPPNAGVEVHTLEPTENMYSGWNTDQILSDVMGVESLENKLYSKLIAQAFAQSDAKEFEGLKSTVAELDKVAHPSDVIVPILKAKLASLVALHHD